MTGLEWVNRVLERCENDDALNAIAYDAIDNITTPSRIARKAREYQAARRAFYAQLALNGVYSS